MPRIPRNGSEEPEDLTTPDVQADEPSTTEETTETATRPSVAERDAAAAESRVSVVNESAPGAEEEEYKWHTGAQRPHGAEDAIEFVDVHKAFGRNKILRGLNMGLPEDRISMILGPSGTGKSVCIKHMSACCTPTRATCSSTASRSPTCRTTSCSRCARSSASCSRTARCSAR